MPRPLRHFALGTIWDFTCRGVHDRDVGRIRSWHGWPWLGGGNDVATERAVGTAL